MVLTGVITETPGGTLGPMFLSAPGCNFVFDSGAYVAADGANTIKLVGDGDFEFDNYSYPAQFTSPVEKFGAGVVLIGDPDALYGTDLRMKEGVLIVSDLAASGALNGSTVTIEAGAAFQPRVYSDNFFFPTPGLGAIGNLTIKAGGALDPHAAPLSETWDPGFQYDAVYGYEGAGLTIEKGAQILLQLSGSLGAMITTPTGVLTGAGNANYIVYFGSHRLNDIGDNALLLSDDTRITCQGDYGVPVWAPQLAAGTTGYVGLVADATEAHITNQSGKGTQGPLNVSAKVDLTGSGSAAGTVGKSRWRSRWSTRTVRFGCPTSTTSSATWTSSPVSCRSVTPGISAEPRPSTCWVRTPSSTCTPTPSRWRRPSRASAT